MNRRSFIGLLAGALPAMAVSNRKYFFAPTGGWAQGVCGLWTPYQGTLTIDGSVVARYRFMRSPSIFDPEGLVSGLWERTEFITGTKTIHNYRFHGLPDEPVEMKIGKHIWKWDGVFSNGTIAKNWQVSNVHRLAGSGITPHE